VASIQRELLLQKSILANRLDSLRKLPWQDSTITRQLRNKLDSLQQLSNSLGQSLSLQGMEIPGIASLNVSVVELPQLENMIEGLNVPALEIPAIDLQVSDLADVDIPKLPDMNVDDLGDLEGLSEVQANVSDATTQLEQAQGYSSDVKNMASGDLGKIEEAVAGLEDKAMQLDEVEELAKYQELMKRYQDPMAMKEEALRKAKQAAVNHFAGHEEELKAALEKFAEVRSKIPDPDGVYDMLKKRSNPLKGKPMKERIVAGLTLQVQKPDALWVDFNPQITYRVSGRWSTGAGWNERIVYDFDENQFASQYRIFGPRMFVHFKLKSNFWLKSDLEAMNVPGSQPTSDFNARSFQVYCFGGFKKDIDLSDGLVANIQMLYNLYDPDKSAPYANRFNIRFGIEFPFTRGRAKSNGD
jgi:hypothetical protein